MFEREGSIYLIRINHIFPSSLSSSYLAVKDSIAAFNQVISFFFSFDLIEFKVVKRTPSEIY